MRNHAANASGSVQCLNHLLIRKMLFLLHGKKNGRNHAAGACGRCGNDPLHAGIGFRNPQSPLHHRSTERPAEKSASFLSVMKPFRIRPHKTACRFQGWVIVLIGCLHSRKNLRHSLFRLFPADSLLSAVVLLHHLPEGFLFRAACRRYLVQ